MHKQNIVVDFVFDLCLLFDKKNLYEFLVGKNGKSMDTKKLVNIQYTYLKRLKIVRCQLEIPTLQVLTENNSTISKRLCKFGL